MVTVRLLPTYLEPGVAGPARGLRELFTDTGDFYRKIFPPTPADLAAAEEPTEAAAAATPEPSTEEEAPPAVSTDTADEPQAKKLKTSTGDLDQEDWEAVEKPEEAANALSEEGEEVETAELKGGDEGKGEKSVAEQEEGTGTGAAHAQPVNMLAKDW